MNYHDTHFHLDLCEDPEKMALQIEKAGVYTIAVTNSPTVFHFTQNLSSTKKYIRAALGLHPELAFERKNDIDQFLELISTTRYIGEIGLDNLNKPAEDYRIQKKIFEKIIDACASQGNKILTVHSRRAATDLIDIVGNRFPGTVILHWFSGSISELEKGLEYGYYVSVNYPMSISESGKKIIKHVPVDRLLIESDGPFTKYGKNPCSPMASALILDNIIEFLRGSGHTLQLKDMILSNFYNLIRPNGS